MKLYIIRHATTKANLTGSMVRNYKNTPIIPFDPKRWMDLIGKHIEKNPATPYITSPALRCIQTERALFGQNPDYVFSELSEFDCSALNGKKFWEISEKEFNDCVKLTSADMKQQVEKLFDKLKYFNPDVPIVCITHGMVARYLYHYLSGNPDITPYDVINSVGFKFANLDMFEYDSTFGTIITYEFSRAICHK